MCFVSSFILISSECLRYLHLACRCGAGFAGQLHPSEAAARDMLNTLEYTNGMIPYGLTTQSDTVFSFILNQSRIQSSKIRNTAVVFSFFSEFL